MFLSHLLINVGDNPDRPRPGRLWLRNLYHVHQRLCMGFPSAERRNSDPDCLSPYQPGDFSRYDPPAQSGCPDTSHNHVHSPRDASSGFLFRVDPRPGAPPVLLVLSAIEPDWDYAFGLKPGPRDSRTGRPIGNADYLLAAPPQVRQWEPVLHAGQQFHFLLQANPVRKVGNNARDTKGVPLSAEWKGSRVPVPAGEEHLRDWLERRAEPRWTPPPNGQGRPPGFRVVQVTSMQPGYVYFKPSAGAKTQRLFSTRYEGVLEVTNPGSFRDTLIRGIGPAKAFGFGLLSIRKIEPSP